MNMHSNPRFSGFLAVFLCFAAPACEGDSHDLGSESDASVSADGGDQPRGDGGVTELNNECSPNGGESCINGREIVICRNGQYEPVASCSGRCLLFDQQFACEGGARAFTPTTVGLIANGAILASISTIDGPIGCGPVDDYGNRPGLAGEQIYLILANVGFGCPAGIYGLDASCDEEYPEGSSARCAIYRRWNGTRLEAVEALAGAVTVSGDVGNVCNYEVQVVLGGQQQTVRFSANVPASTTHQSCVAPS